MSSLRFTEINFIGNNQEKMKMLLLIFLVLLVDIVNFVMADVFIDLAALLVNIAKDYLLTGQEQACTRITRLFGCLFGCHHAEKGLIYRKWLLTGP